MGKNLFVTVTTIACYIILTGFFASIGYPFPYWSYVETHGPRYQSGTNPIYLPQFSDHDSGPSDRYSSAGISVVKVTTDGVTYIMKYVESPITTVLGYAEAYSDPQKGELKLNAYGINSASTGNYIGWDICWGGYCGPYVPGELGGGGGRAYARSVWEVKSDSLPVGTPVSMELSISLEGEFKGDRTNDGEAEVRMHAWLYTPEVVATFLNLHGVPSATTQSIMNALYKDDFNPIGWWADLGFSPNLAIYASNYGGAGHFHETQTLSFPNTGPGGGAIPAPGEGTSLIPANGEPGPSPTPTSLTEIKVGDILILELELWGGVTLFNDANLNGVPSVVEADFFNTGAANFNVLTPGVYLEPAQAPVPIPPSIFLFGSGLIPFFIFRNRKNSFLRCKPSSSRPNPYLYEV